MSLPGVVRGPLAEWWLLIRAHLDERTRRLLLGAEAKVLGRVGIEDKMADLDVVAACTKGITFQSSLYGGFGGEYSRTST